MNSCDSTTRAGQRARIVPAWHLLLVAVAVGVLAWVNVNVTFAVADRYLSSHPILKLFGSWLPHAIGLAVSYLLLCRLGQLQLSELGLQRRGLITAFVITCGFWCLTGLSVQWRAADEMGLWSWNQQLVRVGAFGLLVDLLVTQWLGNALLEEVVFRGYFFTQLKRRFQALASNHGLTTGVVCTALAALVSVILFAACHLPIRLQNGIVGSELLQNMLRLSIWGMIFTLLYAVSNNLWLVIGIHGLTNRPCLWAEPAASVRPVQLQLCLMIIAGYTVIAISRIVVQRRASHPESAPPSESTV